MLGRTIAAAFTAAACSITGAANAEPVKIALIETLSGGQAVTGKLFQSSVKYGLAKLKVEKAWPDGIKLLEYDNQGGPSEAADKVKAAINDGAQIIIQGASSAIGGQITADVQKHNARNPGNEIMWINVGAEAMEFTGPKCHFYHFRWNGNAEIRLRALLTAMKDTKTLGTKVYVIGRKRGEDVLRPLSPEHPDDETFDGLLILRPEGRLFFANAQQVGDRIRALVAEHRPRVLALDMSRVPDIEYSALQMLVDGERQVTEDGITVWLAGLNPSVLECIRSSSLATRLGEDRLLFNARAVIRKYQVT